MSNYGRCFQCGASWEFTDGHSTLYDSNMGCSPLCDKCWSSLTPEQRLPYYRSLWVSWLGEVDDDLVRARWPAIEAAVLEGK